MPKFNEGRTNVYWEKPTLPSVVYDVLVNVVDQNKENKLVTMTVLEYQFSLFSRTISH